MDDKELEALLLGAAQRLRYGVVGVDEARAADWHVPVGKLLREGQELPDFGVAPKTGYYCLRAGVPIPSFYIDEADNGAGRVHYRLVVLQNFSTAHWSFEGQNRAFSLDEMKAYLRGIDDAMRFVERFR